MGAEPAKTDRVSVQHIWSECANLGVESGDLCAGVTLWGKD